MVNILAATRGDELERGIDLTNRGQDGRECLSRRERRLQFKFLPFMNFPSFHLTPFGK